MALFLVTPLTDNASTILQALKEVDGLDFFELQESSGFLISDTGTTQEISNKIGLTHPDEEHERKLGPALVTRVSSYYGIGSTLMWEWMQSRLERS